MLWVVVVLVGLVIFRAPLAVQVVVGGLVGLLVLAVGVGQPLANRRRDREIGAYVEARARHENQPVTRTFTASERGVRDVTQVTRGTASDRDVT